MWRQLGGIGGPTVVAEKGAVADADLDKVHNGKSLRDLLRTGSIRDFVVSTHGPLRRISSVHSVQAIPPHLHLAAAVVGARLLEYVRVPVLIRTAPRLGCCVYRRC